MNPRQSFYIDLTPDNELEIVTIQTTDEQRARGLEIDYRFIPPWEFFETRQDCLKTAIRISQELGLTFAGATPDLHLEPAPFLAPLPEVHQA